jgi:hypothetical protein
MLPRLLPVGVAVVLFFAARHAVAADEVTVHEFDPKTGVDEREEARPKSVLYLNPGPLISFIGGHENSTGFGGELSAMYYPRGTWQSLGYGAFAQGMVIDGKHPRFALGGQSGLGPVGAELGLAYRGGDDIFASTASVHAGVFISIGVLDLAFRVGIPIIGTESNRASYGFDTALTIALKLPIVIFGHDKTGIALGN